MDIDINNPPLFDEVPIDAYGGIMPDDDDHILDSYDIGVIKPEVKSDVPPPPVLKAKTETRPRKAVALKESEFVEEVMSVPDRLSGTVIGALAKVMHEKIEFPEVSAFLSLLASASCSVATAYTTEYITGSAVALGMYVIVEQPPAMMKSYLLDVGMNPYRLAMGKHNKKITAKNREMVERGVENFIPMARGFTETSDGTSASIDGFLSGCSEGRFVIASAEQSGLISLFPEGTYSSTNELILKGYVSEYISGMRATRKAFSGIIQGSIVIIAQPGSSKRVLTASGGSGMAERFIYIAEPDPIGFRRNEGKFPSREEKSAFEYACAKCVELYSDSVMACANVDQAERVIMDPQNLYAVKASIEGYRLIKQQKDANESYLYDLKMAGEMVMMGWLAKIETHVLKIAANVHIIECLANNCKVSEVIPTWIIEDSISLVMMLAGHIKGIMNTAGESGDTAEEETIVELLSRGSMNKRALALAAKNRKPFRSMPGGYKIATSRIDAMMASGQLIVTASGKIEAL